MAKTLTRLEDGRLTSLSVGTRRITVSREGETWTTTPDWTSRSIKPDFNDYVVDEGHVYGFDGNTIACVDLETGEGNWKRGRYGNGQVLLLHEQAPLLILSETGELVLATASPESLAEIAMTPVLEGKTWNHPVLIGNRVHIRNGREAACIELPPAEPTLGPVFVDR